MTANETKQAVLMLCEAYRQKPTEITYVAYHTALSDLDKRHVERAIQDSIRSASKWMPQPGELRQAAERQRGEALRVAKQAWQHVVASCAKDPLAKKIAKELRLDPTQSDFYTTGRMQFLNRYTMVLHQHRGSLRLAIESMCQNQLPAPEAGK